MSLIICKKCGGPHITIRCGKETKPIEIKKPEELNTYVPRKNNMTYSSYKKEDNKHFDKRKIVTIRLSNLPDDITVIELERLIKPWGSIGRINLNNFENKSGFIDFNFKDEADYFIKALDRTPFDNMIIRAELIENKY